uniref:Coronin n=1 Tax=Haptolina ericina TaxID=156174 RepID=A0A7S3BM28_9EUKA|mmetsp:Transcript_61983/g.138102  ORF Transcript_61983/g.138102 Transcript_61983/m.138102 type:complete len:434 (+) Transcript_61983:395-1696(+)
MGRLVYEFTQHSGAITAVAIHPTEFLMATAATDRTLRLWDLERFEQVCCMPPESGQVRRVAFSDDGQALLAGGEESLKVWGWEPVCCLEHAEVRWGRLSDMGIGPNQQLVAGSVREAVVAVWNVDLKAMKPFSTVGEGAAAPVLASAASGTPCSPANSGSAPSPGISARGGGRGWSLVPPAAYSPTECRPPDAQPVAIFVPGSEVSAATPAQHDCSADAAILPDEAPFVRGAADEVTASCARLHIADCRARISAVRTQSKDSRQATTDGVVGTQADKHADKHADKQAEVMGAVDATSRQASERRSIGTSMGDSISRPSDASACSSPVSASTAPSAPSVGAPRIKGNGFEHPSCAPPPPSTTSPHGQLSDLATYLPMQGAAQSSRPGFNGGGRVFALLENADAHRSQLSSRLAALRSLRRLWDAGDVRKVCCRT